MRTICLLSIFLLAQLYTGIEAAIVGPCKDIHDNVQDDYKKFVTIKSLHRDHALFITLDNKIFNSFKTNILNQRVDGPIDVAKRDITLDIIEEFQASEVPHYSRLHKGHGIYEKEPMRELCHVSLAIVKALSNTYLKKPLDKKHNPGAIRSVVTFYEKQITLRTESVLRKLFIEGRQDIRKINEAIFDLERIATTEPQNAIIRITDAGNSVFKRFTDMEASKTAETLAKSHTVG